MSLERQPVDVARSVVFHPLARSDLFNLYDFIADRSDSGIAAGYLRRIETLCANLATFPNRGTDRPDLGPAVRTQSLERRVLIAYGVASDSVMVLRVMYAGRAFDADDLPR